jgi:hypothetical protein
MLDLDTTSSAGALNSNLNADWPRANICKFLLGPLLWIKAGDVDWQVYNTLPKLVADCQITHQNSILVAWYSEEDFIKVENL